MKSACVITAGKANHPQTNASLMRIEVDRPWAQAGERYPGTEIWGEGGMPQPQTGEPIQWDGGHIWYRGVRYEKPEYDRNPDPSKPFS